MNKKNMVTVGQLFTLLFISRISLAILYSATVSGIHSIWNFFLPLLISIPVSIILLIPVNLLYAHSRKQSVCSIAVQHSPILGYTVTILYAVYFFGSCLYAVMALENFLDMVLPDGIHAKAVLVLLVTACIYAAVKGIEALSRMAAVVLGFILLSAVFMVIYLMQGFSSENIFPVEYVTFSTVIDCVILIVSRMNTSAALNVLAPSAKGNLLKSTVVWSTLVFLFMCFMLILFRGAVGDYLNAREFPVYSASEGAGTLQRLNPFFIFVTMCSLFCHTAVLLLAASESVTAIFHHSFGKIISIIIGILLVGAALAMPKSTIIFDKYIWCTAAVIFTFAIPLIIYITVKMPRHHRKFAKRTIRTASMTIIISMIMLIYGGCSNAQLNQRIIVQGIGIDRQNDSCHVTLIVLDTENEDKENAVRLMYTDGKTTDEALYTLENQRGKKLLLSQCLFIMMDKETAQNNVQTLHCFADTAEIQKTTNLMVTDGSAENTISTAVDKLGYQSEYINLLADSKAVNQTEVHCSLLDYMSSLENDSKALLFPYITVNETISALSVNGSYLVDGKYHCILTGDETLGTLIVNKQVTDFTDTVHTISREVNYTISSTSSNIIPAWKNDHFLIEFDIQVYLDNEYDGDIPQTISDHLRTSINSAIDKTVSANGSDVFSIGKAIRNAYPKIYSQSDIQHLLQTAVIHTDITAHQKNQPVKS